MTYRVAQEALTNAVRHSGASCAELRARRTATEIVLEISDDGAGFDPSAATAGFGLLGMRERAGLARGTVDIASPAGRGTCVTLTIPVG